MNMFVVYALIDPQNDFVRYVGKTTNSRLGKRFYEHCSQLKSRNHRTNWIRKLLRLGHKPKIETLEEYPTWIEAKNAEIFYISYFKYLGFDLVNETEGGEGCLGRI